MYLSSTCTHRDKSFKKQKYALLAKNINQQHYCIFNLFSRTVYKLASFYNVAKLTLSIILLKLINPRPNSSIFLSNIFPIYKEISATLSKFLMLLNC